MRGLQCQANRNGHEETHSDAGGYGYGSLSVMDRRKEGRVLQCPMG